MIKAIATKMTWNDNYFTIIAFIIYNLQLLYY